MQLDPLIYRCRGTTRLPGLPVRHKTCDRRNRCLLWLSLKTKTERTPIARHLCDEHFAHFWPVK